MEVFDRTFEHYVRAPFALSRMAIPYMRERGAGWIVNITSSQALPVERPFPEYLRIEGDLTLHGVTKPLTLHARLNKSAANPFDKKPTLGFSASGSLKRTDFGISTYVPIIGDVVAITIDAEFNRKS